MSFWRLFSSLWRRPPPPEPALEASVLVRDAYRAWARGAGHAIAERGGVRIRGTVAGRRVVVDPGIDGRVPGWVQVTVAVSLPSAPPLLVTRATERRHPLTAAVRALFDDPHIGAELRAISVAPGHLRLRLAPGAEPVVVERAVAAAAAALRELYAPELPDHEGFDFSRNGPTVRPT